MRTYVFLDLDDTILQTLSKCGPDDDLLPAGFARDGQPLSFTTAKQRAMLEMLSASATVIPTTARNLDAFRRVRLAFSDLAILDFGGVILRPDGTPDPVWDAHVRPLAASESPHLARQLRDVQRFIDDRRLGVVARLIVDFDMPLYLVLKHPEGNVDALDIVRREYWATVDPSRAFVHANGNNLSLVPRFLGKELAVRHVLDHLPEPGPVLSIGVGDSLSDAPFLGECDFALVPQGSQLSARLAMEGDS